MTAEELRHPPYALAPGTLLHNRYQVEQLAHVGINCYTLLYRAIDRLCGCRVAIRELIPGRGTPGECVRMGSRLPAGDSRWQAAVQLFHDAASHAMGDGQIGCCVPVTDAFRENNTVYSVMSWVEGESLAELLRRSKLPEEQSGSNLLHSLLRSGGPLPELADIPLYWRDLSENRIHALLAPVLDTLEQLHARGSVHGYVTTEQILIDRQGKAHLAGMDGFHEGRMLSLLAPGPQFASPMQAPEMYLTTIAPGSWTDVYGISAVYWLLITGILPPQAHRRPPEGDDLPVENGLTAALRCGLYPLPGWRFATVGELRSAMFCKVERNERQPLLPDTILNSRWRVGSCFHWGDTSLVYRARDLQTGREMVVREYMPSDWWINYSGSRLRQQNVLLGSKAHFSDGCMSGFGIAAADAEPDLRVIRLRGRQSMQSRGDFPRVEDVFDENGTVYLAAPFAPGRTLRERIESGEYFSFEKILSILRQPMEQLAASGTVHGYISTENLIWEDGRPCTLVGHGFPHANELRLEERDDLDIFQYIDRERPMRMNCWAWDSQRGPQSDVYSLCAVIYTAVTGSPPPRFATQPLPDIPLTQINPWELDILRRGMEVRPEDRYRNVAELLRALDTAGPRLP